MISKIRIKGFKSLLDTELYFGPFTCIAGANAVGKSNLFDAIIFLSNLADHTILHAAKSIRSENQKHSDIKDLFYKSHADYLEKMSFEVDMLVPQAGKDDLGQKAEAKITSLRYVLELRLNKSSVDTEPIEIVREDLLPVTLGEARKNIFFENSKDWISSVLKGRRSTKNPFISTQGNIIKLHSDSKEKKRGGRTTEFIADKMPRTLLSTVTAESPTAFLARLEMRNWMMLQLEPSALRQPNLIYEVKNAEITASGHHLPATLYRLRAELNERDIYQEITNKLKELVNDVDEIIIDKDDKRDLLTLQLKFKGGLVLPAQSLSDGTLRFLSLAVIEKDNKSTGLICLEEPENGINPKKVQAMVELLKGMAVDTTCPVDEDNPLRQIIINTHSPIVVSAVPDESLYLAKNKEIFAKQFNRKVKITSFSALKETWKTKNSLVKETTLGEIDAYLDKDRLLYKTATENESKIKKSLTVSENINNQLSLDLK